MGRVEEKKNKNPLALYAGRTWWRYLIASVCMIVSVILDVWFPLITMSIVDDVIIGGNMAVLKKDLICILIVGFGRAVSQYLKEFNSDVAGSVVATSARKNLFNHIQTLSRSYFKQTNTGELMARVKDDVDRIWDLFGYVGMLMTEAVCYLIFTAISMIKLDWKLSLIPLMILPLMGYLAIRLEKKLDIVYDDISEQNATLNNVVQENLSGVRTVKSFAREDYELEKFRTNNRKYSEYNIKQAMIMARFDPDMSFIPKVMQVIVLLTGGYAVIKGNLTFGVLTAFIQYSNNIVWPMENLGWLTNCIAAAFASNKKINAILAEEPEIKDPENPVKPDRIEGNLRFNDVSFSLDNQKIIDHVSFELKKGKTLGIMGATGSGKSTIVNLINRFYDVDEGSITIDGIDVRKLSIETVRGCTAVVSQDVFLFSDTVEDNIKLGKKTLMDDVVVRKSVETAHAEEFVNKLSDGYDTVIGERGVGLSGGQKQRLSLARAIARNAQILIMDDSTSALDMETEYEIQQSLAEMTDTGKIIIAHRISSVRHADEIIVLDNGHIAERGTHEELLDKKGLYYSTYEAQYGDYRKAKEVIGKEGLVCR